MKIYHVETQEAYDTLMSELEEKGREWLSGYKPTAFNYWKSYKENTCIKISGKDIAYRDIERCKKQHPNIPIIKYKAKGENMTQEEMKQKLKKNIFEIYGAIDSFARGISEAEADLQEAKSSAKKLIEKIDEYLESQKPKFKVGDYVTVYVNGKEKIAKIDELTENNSKAHGLWYDRTLVNVKQDYWFPSGLNEFRHATPTEILEYEVALTFHKHGRKPFEVKEGDIISYSESDKIFVDVPSFWGKEDFTSGDYTLVKTAEEYNEWIENK